MDRNAVSSRHPCAVHTLAVQWALQSGASSVRTPAVIRSGAFLGFRGVSALYAVE